MATIIQGTTPSLEIVIPGGVAVADISDLRIDLMQGDLVICKSLNDIMIDKNFNKIYLPLTELETLSFSAGVVNVQLRYRLEGDTNIRATYINPIKVYPMGVPSSMGSTGCGCHGGSSGRPNRNPGMGVVDGGVHYVSTNDYNNLDNAPIVGLVGRSDISFINLAGLKEGHYTLKGYYKFYTGGDMFHIEKPLEIQVFEGNLDDENWTPVKVILYISMELGETYRNKLVYHGSQLVEKKKTPLEGPQWGTIDKEDEEVGLYRRA